MRITNKNLINAETSTSFGVLKFDANGCAEVAEEAAEALLQVPGFAACEDCTCGKAEPKKEPSVASSSTASSEPATGTDEVKTKIAAESKRGRPKKGAE